MNDTVAQPGTVALEPPSTVLNPQTVPHQSGGGVPDLSAGKGDNSPAAVMEAELARMKAEYAGKGEKEKPAVEPKEGKPKEGEEPKGDKVKTEDKAKAEPKDKAHTDDGKFAKTEGDKPDAKAVESAAEKPATERAGQVEDRQSEGRKHSEPPARFLPEARAKWANVPNEVKTEFHRVSQEYETEIQRVRPAVEAYESVREYDEMAKGAGTTMRDAMQRYVEIDKLLISNPAQGITRVLQAIGVTPQQLAQEITNNPKAFEVQAHQQPPQPQPSPDMQRLQQENETLRAHAVNTAAKPIIDAFAAAHTDYPTLEAQILSILKSGVINEIYGTGLTPAQRLEQAYRMAGGNTPSRSEPEPAPAHSAAPAERPVNPDAGTKSVRGAPSDGADTAADDEPTELRDLLRKELRKIA